MVYGSLLQWFNGRARLLQRMSGQKVLGQNRPETGTSSGSVRPKEPMSSSSWETLPQEICLVIFSHIDFMKWPLQLVYVCRSWRFVAFVVV
jgi:hypothetical protein